MPAKLNKHGLSRTVPEDVKRQLRKRCGYGCVVCGSFVIDYEHLNPQFIDAKEHDPNFMTLLCPIHHRAKNGWMTSAAIEKANEKPFALKQGFSRFDHRLGDTDPTIKLGRNTFRRVETLIQIFGEKVIWILAPEETGAPFRLNAQLRNDSGELILNIVNNEWRASTINWDVVATYNSLCLRSAKRAISLEVSFDGSNIVFERIEMKHRSIAISCGLKDRLVVSNGPATFQQVGGSIYQHCKIGIDVTNDRLRVGVGGSLSSR
jgi:hypothetical protein